MIPGRRPTFSDPGGMAVPPFESHWQVCRPTITLGRPGTGSCLTHGFTKVAAHSVTLAVCAQVR